MAKKRNTGAPKDLGWESFVLSGMGAALGERLPDQTRQRLAPLIPTLLGTGHDNLDNARGGMAADWLVRTWTPAWLDLLTLGAQATSCVPCPPVTDVQPVKVAEQVLTAITDPFVEWPEDDEEATALAAARAHAEESRDQIREKVMGVVVSAMAADSCSGAAWDAVCDAFDVFLPMLFYTPHMRRLHPLVRDAALAAIIAADQPRDPADAYVQAVAWLRPSVDRLQNSAVDLFADMVHPPAPFVLAYQQESKPEPEPW